MANHAYARFWCRDFSQENMLDLFERFLGTVPFSAAQPGFTSLTIRAVDPGETPVAEHDMRQRPSTAAEVIAVAREHAGWDSSFETHAWWDLWVFTDGAWQPQPCRMELTCNGEAYDDGVFAQEGHFQLDAGFEHLFTGHAGLLGIHGTKPVNPPRPVHPAEAEFLRQMSEPENLRTYHEKTQENIARLLKWVDSVKAALPCERYTLLSEGEANFEARLDEILAAR